METIRNELKEQVKELFRNDALKKSLDIQRNLLVENCLEEEDMDVGNTETEEIEVTPPVIGPQTFSFSDIQVNYLEIKDENAKLKENLEEKENFILELEKKIKNLEKDIKKYETDIDKAKTECTDAIGKASDLCEENTLLLEQVRTYKNILKPIKFLYTDGY